MPKKKAEVTETEETVKESGVLYQAPEDNVTTTSDIPVKIVESTRQSDFVILNPDGSYLRTYSVAEQGENAEKLAKEFLAGHPSYTLQ